MERVTVFVRGEVQGVGFRWWTRARALELGLVGHARNLPDGRVEVVVQGAGESLDRLIALLEPEAPALRHGPSRPAGRPGTVAGVVTQWGRARPGVTGFAEK